MIRRFRNAAEQPDQFGRLRPGSDRHRRAVILQKYPRPCRIDLFSELSRTWHGELIVLYYGARLEPRRQWTIAEDAGDFLSMRVGHLHIPWSYEKAFYVPTNLATVLDDLQPDVVVGSFDSAGLVASTWCRRTEKSFVLWSEEHGASLENLDFVRLRQFVRRLQLKRASRCIVPGSLSATHLQHHGYAGPLDYVPNSVAHQSDYRAIGEERTASGVFIVEDEPLELLFAGSLLPRKGIQFLLSHWRSTLLRAKRPMLLHVAGDGPAVDQSSAPPSVIFHGHLTGRAYQRLVAQCDVFVLPSLFDPNPLVVAEALWSGMPLVLSDGVGNWPEAVEDNGFVFRAGDSLGLQRALLGVAEASSTTLLAWSNRSTLLARFFDVRNSVRGFIRALDDQNGSIERNERGAR